MHEIAYDSRYFIKYLYTFYNFKFKNAHRPNKTYHFEIYCAFFSVKNYYLILLRNTTTKDKNS